MLSKNINDNLNIININSENKITRNSKNYIKMMENSCKNVNINLIDLLNGYDKYNVNKFNYINSEDILNINNPIVKLYIKIDNKLYLGTGFFISKKYVLTTFNFINEDIKNDLINIIISDYKLNNTYNANKIYISKKLKNNLDLIIIEIKEKYYGKVWNIETPIIHDKLFCNISGYPYEKTDYKIYNYKSYFKLFESNIIYDENITPTLNGSPIYYEKYNKITKKRIFKIVGIHVYNNNCFNMGIPITKEIIIFINNVKNNTNVYFMLKK